jgi:hypothetical protein
MDSPSLEKKLREPSQPEMKNCKRNELEEVICQAIKGATSEVAVHFHDRPPNGNTTSCTSSPRRPSIDKQIFNILKDIPGVDPKKFRKPKIPNSAKLSHLARCGVTKDALMPILFHILERFLQKQNPGDDVERELFEYLRNIDPESLKVMKSYLKKFRELPQNYSEGIFVKEFLEWPISRTIPSEKIIGSWISEGLQLVATKAMGGDNMAEVHEPTTRVMGGDNMAGGTATREMGGDNMAEVHEPTTRVMGGNNGVEPGLVRPWKVNNQPSKEHYTPSSEEAPWPHICGVSTSEDYNKIYRNEDFLPELRGTLKAHETAHVCTPKMASDGVTVARIDCPPIRPKTPPSPSGAFVMPECDGGPTYMHKDVCLKIPDSFPGQGIMLTGFNFFSKNCKVKLTKIKDKDEEEEITYTLPGYVVGETSSPITEGTPSCYKVHDTLSFSIPAHGVDGYSDFVSGRYMLTVIVPNDVGYELPVSGSSDSDIEPTMRRPKQFMSNFVYLQISPDPKISYRIWNDGGYCHETTDGPGSDEIWIKAIVQKMEAYGKLPPPYHVEIPHSPWEPMDDDKDTDENESYSVDIYNDPSPFNGAIIIGLVGYEVDSESAAKEQITSFDEAFFEYLKKVAIAVGLVGGAAEVSGYSVKDIIGSLGASNSIYALIIVLVIIAVTGTLYAAWAPADLVMQDTIILNTAELYKLTDVKEPVPSASVPRKNYEMEVAVFPKDPKTVDSIDSATAEYKERRRYIKFEGDFLTAARTYHIGSNYEMRFHYKRNP